VIGLVAEITDEFMKEMLAKTRHYCLVILKDGPNCNRADARKIIWAHGRRNFALRRDGLLPIVCPVSGDGDIAGIGIFNASVNETKKIMDEDPAVKEGVLVYEIFECRSFPGDCLPDSSSS
jgi:hypothetical protein